jgi:hypothetical protein
MNGYLWFGMDMADAAITTLKLIQSGGSLWILKSRRGENVVHVSSFVDSIKPIHHITSHRKSGTAELMPRTLEIIPWHTIQRDCRWLGIGRTVMLP